MSASDWLKQSVQLFTRKAVLAPSAVPAAQLDAASAPSALRTTQERIASRKLKAGESLKPKALAELLARLHQILDTSISEIEAGQRAQAVAHWYAHAKPGERQDCWALMSEQFGLDALKVESALQRMARQPMNGDAEIALRRSLNCTRTQLIQRFSAFPDGVRFLINLRADLLSHLRMHPNQRASLQALDRELETLFATWFDVAFLELRKISWDSPASLIEKLIQYEAVHHIQSWADVKNRLDSDRRCYGFFHPRLPDEPLIFVEVVFTADMASHMAPILDDAAARTDVSQVKTANFYSISNTQAGLKGVGFGDSLIKQVVQALQQEFSQLRTFTTLSPIPTLKPWLQQNIAMLLGMTGDKQLKKLAQSLKINTPLNAQHVHSVLESLDAQPLPAADSELALWLTQCAAHYLSSTGADHKPKDPVARFHLSNGATLARLNWGADASNNGLRQSCGLMVNYLYDLKRLDKNRQQLQLGKIAQSSAMRSLKLVT